MIDKQAIVAKLAPLLEGKDPHEIIEIAYQELSDNLMMTTAFGYSGIVLLSFVKNLKGKIPIYFIDTGYHFEETLKLRKKIMADWNLDIQRLSAESTQEELIELYGPELFRSDPDKCCHYRKVEPLMSIMHEDTIWLSGTRQDQSPTRANTKLIEIDGRGQIKINPIAHWTSDQCWNHIRKFDLPYNPLHDQFYPSVGCYPCTAPADKGGDERSGRWTGSDKIECGLHIASKGPK